MTVRARKFISVSTMLSFVKRIIMLTNSTEARIVIWKKPTAKALCHLLNFQGWFMAYFIILNPYASSSAKLICMKMAQKKRQMTFLMSGGGSLNYYAKFSSPSTVSGLLKTDKARKIVSESWAITKKRNLLII